MRKLSRKTTNSSAEVALTAMTPRAIVAELDRYIIGQSDAKRAVAIAIRNRWRRQQLPEDFQKEVSPKNILMIGPTGVGKTEIARRLAKMTNAPFVKVEATKYTEVGYYGRDVESIIRELVENSIGIVRSSERIKVEGEAKVRTNERLLDILCPPPVSRNRNRSSNYDPFRTMFSEVEPTVTGFATSKGEESEKESDLDETYEIARKKMGDKLAKGDLEDKKIEITVEQNSTPMMMSGAGLEHMGIDVKAMFEKISPRSSSKKEMSVAEARHILFEQECDKLLDSEKINSMAIELAENMGIVFIDEIDKVVASEGKGADVSRQGVQRDLLPIVEGTTVQTRYGFVKTDFILFVAAGAFHKAQPSDLMPELQGRFPIRVELKDLTKEDFIGILKEPRNSLTRQYEELLRTEGVELEFTDGAIEELAAFAYKVNRTTVNIGARRLYTILERLLEELSFDAPDAKNAKVQITAEYVRQRLQAVAADEDLSKYIL